MNINLSNVKKSFKKQTVLDNVNLNVESGTIMCLLGPSGSGKTTLIRIIIGALKADEGTIKIGEYGIPGFEPLKHIGFMPQNDGVYNDMSAMDNLKFYGQIHRIKKRELNERVEKTLKLVELWDERNKLVTNYSGGMKKRLSLAIALLHEPEVLLLDEPTVGIDPLLRRSIWDEFHKLKISGKTIIVSTHVMDEVKECDNAAFLYYGQIIKNDTVDNILESFSGNIEEIFLKWRTNNENNC